MSCVKISEVSSRHEAMMEAIRRWTRGINRGEGFFPEVRESDVQVLISGTPDEVDVYECWRTGEEYAVGEANGSWAVWI